jgi:hypothetical protein
MDGVATTCGYFLSVALCPPGNTATPADSMSPAVDGSFLSATSGTVQEPFACMIPGN